MKSTLCFALIIILLISLSLVSSQYVFPDHHFINCGSNSNIVFYGKTFNGDVKPVNFSVSGGRGRTATNNNYQVSEELYKTARVFNTKSWYNLEADDTYTFVMVRLHFFPFSNNEFDLSNSKFNVSVNGFNVLPGVNVVKEVIIPIGPDKTFRIEFIPFNESFPAFVNAIEAFTTPKQLFGQYDLSNISTTSYAFSPIHRINVGGQRVERDSDTLGRIWIPDDPFIISSLPATNKDGPVNYRDNGASAFDAPNDVYSTAKELTNKAVNLTWSFGVTDSAMYLVRAHFCDVISIGLRSADDAFNFFVDSRFKQVIPPDGRQWDLQVPFYVDSVVTSVESKFVNVSIGAISGNNQAVFLNGIEIMQLLYTSGRADIPTDGKKSKKVMPIVVGCVIGGVVLVLVLLVGFFIGSKYGRAKRAVVGAKPESNMGPSNGRSSYTGISLDFTVNHPSPIPSLNLNLRFPLVDILLATNNFDEKLMIGKGGFGKVYKGILYNDVKVAVKRGEKGHGQGRPEFVTEILVLSKIRHQHLVTLIGYCDEKSEMILVYEYMEKGTLQDHLYDVKDNPKLSWSQRLEICISATRGLHYLHTGSDAGIIHRDVKSTNILLNEKYVAKVADFGISRLDNVDEGDITDIKGSFGYLDPEYIRCMKLTQKSDVYSFGVVLLEVLCARPALDNTLPPKEANLADWAIRNIKNGMAEAIIDPFLVDTISPNSLRKFLETVERCLKDTGEERPSMIDVLWDLEYALKLQQMVVDKEPYDDSTMNTSLQLPISVIHRLPSNINDDDSEVNDSSLRSYPSESQVFSQLKIDEAR